MWTATVVASAVDHTNDRVGIVVTVEYSNGTIKETRSHRGLQSPDAVTQTIANTLDAFNAADALAQSVAMGVVSIAPPLSAAQVTALSPSVDRTQSQEANLVALNAATVKNPVAQGNVPKPLSVIDIFGLLTDTEQGAVVGHPNAAPIIADVRMQDRQAVATWASGLAKGGTISSASLNGVMGYLNSTVPDPNWQAVVSPAMAALGRPATIADVLQVRGA